MDVVLLRKLSRKSIINFGKKEGYSVQQMLDLKEKGYLRWMYFNCSMISFLDDILDEINITEDFRIQKPGTNKEKHEELITVIRSHTYGLTKFINNKKFLKNEKARVKSINSNASLRLSKQYLANKNHGR